MTTAILIGGTGFIGKNLAQTLRSQGYEVFVAGRPGKRQVTDSAPDAFDFDLRDSANIAATLDRIKPDVVFHLASNLLPASTLDQYLIERREILEPTMALVDRLANDGTLFVYLSSGGTIYGSQDVERMAESDSCFPISIYGNAKLEFENYLRFMTRTKGLRHLIARPSNPFGCHQALDGNQGLIAVLIGKALRQEPLEVWGNGLVVRDYIYIDDLCDALYHLTAQTTHDDTFNIGSGTGHSLLEVVDTVEQAVGRKIELLFRPSRSIDVPRVVLDISKSLAVGVRPPRPLRDGIDAFVTTLGIEL